VRPLLGAASPARATVCNYYLQPTGPPSLTGNIDVIGVPRGCFATDQQATSAAAPSGDVLIGRDWAASHYEGDELKWYADQECSSSVSYSDAYIGDGWNDRVSSADTNGHCNQFLHFKDRDFGLPGVTCTCYEMGNLNNETSSEKWKHG
jgi:hypothetical protein